MGYKDDLRIDRHTLDEEWMRQPGLFAKYSEEYAESIFLRDKAKDQMELINAEIDSDVRADPVEFGMEGKVTDKAIASAVSQAEEVIQAKGDYLEACKDCNVLLGAKISFEHKKSALDALVKLYLSGYWGEVKVPVEAKDKFDTEQQTKGLQENVRLKLKGSENNG